MKKIKLLVILCLVFVITGCGVNNNAPDSIAKQMIEKMSKGDYKNVSELIYVDEEDVYIDEVSFEKYLDTKNLNIKGNKNVEVIDYKEPGENVDQKSILVKIDNNKVIEVKTVKKDEKWYVNLDEYDFDELVFLAPLNSVVELNGIKINKEKYSEVNDSSIRMSYTYENANVKMDKYELNTLKGFNYKLKVYNNDMVFYDGNIDFEYDNYKNTGIRNNDDEFIAISKLEDNLYNKINNSVKNYFDTFFLNINEGKEITELKVLFNNYGEFEKKYLSNYNNFIKAKKDETSSSSRIKDQFKLTNLELYKDGIYYLSDDCIIVVGTYKFSYHYLYTSKYSDGVDKTIDETENFAMILKKDGLGYKIDFSNNIVPYFY